jgi:hypothetical protein
MTERTSSLNERLKWYLPIPTSYMEFSLEKGNLSTFTLRKRCSRRGKEILVQDFG